MTKQNYTDAEINAFDFVKLLCPPDIFPEMIIHYKENQKRDDIESESEYEVEFSDSEIDEMEIDEVEELIHDFKKIDLNKLKVTELKQKCKENKIKGYSKCKKKELIELLKNLHI